jgi:hypothetical protein
MDPESKKILDETLALTKENNLMLYKIRKFQKWDVIWSWLKVLLILGLAFGSFYFLEPYFNKLVLIWDSVSGAQQQSSGNPFQDFLKKL